MEQYLRRNPRRFTLIEPLVVIAIIAILAAMPPQGTESPNLWDLN